MKAQWYALDCRWADIILWKKICSSFVLNLNERSPHLQMGVSHQVPEGGTKFTLRGKFRSVQVHVKYFTEILGQLKMDIALHRGKRLELYTLPMWLTNTYNLSNLPVLFPLSNYRSRDLTAFWTNLFGRASKSTYLKLNSYIPWNMSVFLIYLYF